MLNDAGKILVEGFELADEVENNSRHVENVVLRLPMDIDAAVGGRGGEVHEVRE
jgi:hypothetical protein